MQVTRYPTFILTDYSNEMQHVNLGTHKSEEEAARAYDAALSQLQGDSRPLNFPSSGVVRPSISMVSGTNCLLTY